METLLKESKSDLFRTSTLFLNMTRISGRRLFLFKRITSPWLPGDVHTTVLIVSIIISKKFPKKNQTMCGEECKAVMEELTAAKRNYNISKIEFWDDIFILDKNG